MDGAALSMERVMTRAAQISEFLAQSGWAGAASQRVAGDASNRRYDRLTRTGGTTAILMDAPPGTGEDVRPFMRIADHLRAIGLSAPEIYHADPTSGLLLIEDFGDALFADLMSDDPAQQVPLYRAATDVLLHLKEHDAPKLNICDATWLIDMTQPFFEWYVGDPDKHASFAQVFGGFAKMAAEGPKVLMLRDYHAQNLLLLPDREGVQQVGILDFQDAMQAHPAYDLVSILQDARRDVSAEIEREILRYYTANSAVSDAEFRYAYAVLGVQRNLRILGIFARLCMRDGKAGYVDFIPRVWGYVQRNLAHPALAPLAAHLKPILPAPTPALLESMKAKCPSPPFPS